VGLWGGALEGHFGGSHTTGNGNLSAGSHLVKPAYFGTWEVAQGGSLPTLNIQINRIGEINYESQNFNLMYSLPERGLGSVVQGKNAAIVSKL
jgi:hypothetical protein